MRISTSLLFNTGLTTINNQQADLMHVMQQMGENRRMTSPADDPLAAAQSINIAQSQALNQRFADNRAVAMRDLGAEENTLESLVLLMQDVQTRVVEAGNGTLSDADRATLSGVLASARETMLGLANATDGNGQYLFSGSQGQTSPYQLVGGRYVYQGDTQQRNIQADQTRQIAGGDVGSDIFNRAQPGTRGYTTSAGPNATTPGPNLGTGVVSKASVTDSSLANINYAYKVEFTSETSYTVTVTDVSTDPATPVSPADPLDPLDLPVSYTLAPGAKTLELGYGMQVQFEGTPQIGDTFGVDPLVHTDVNVFDTLGDLITALNSPSSVDATGTAALRNVLNSSIQRLTTSYDNILTVRASVGARMNELESLDTNGTQRNLGYTTALEDLEGLDFYDATMKLNLRKMALEGAALAFKTIQNMSLFNMGGR
ncbi:flagellar hook-associated protein FlgL [Alcaligenaceae bacterium CGII-47]|nr:flagellar hook-associated protein FlgL [Alcaligenaceae bacterium CGII-47]